MKNEKGFTLIELIVVIAVIGILATMGTVAAVSLTKKAHENSAMEVGEAVFKTYLAEQKEKDYTFKTSEGIAIIDTYDNYGGYVLCYEGEAQSFFQKTDAGKDDDRKSAIKELKKSVTVTNAWCLVKNSTANLYIQNPKMCVEWAAEVLNQTKNTPDNCAYIVKLSDGVTLSDGSVVVSDIWVPFKQCAKENAKNNSYIDEPTYVCCTGLTGAVKKVKGVAATDEELKIITANKEQLKVGGKIYYIYNSSTFS